MKSALDPSLAQRKIIKQNNRLKLSKQNLPRKSSVLLVPIVLNKSPPDRNSLDSGQLNYKITSISKNQKLKISNEESKQTPTKSFHAYQQKNRSNQKSASLIKHQKSNGMSLNNSPWVNKGNKRLTINPNFHNQLQLNKDSYQILGKSSNQIIDSQNNIHENYKPKTPLNNPNKDKNNQMKEVNLQKQLNQKEYSSFKQQTTNVRLYKINQAIQQSLYTKKQSNILIKVPNNHHLRLISNIVKCHHFPQLDCDQSKENSGNERIQQLFYLNSIKQSIQEQSRVLDKMRKSQLQLHGQITIKQQLLNQLQFKHAQLKGQLQKINTQYQLIVNFSTNQERNRILKIVSKDYLELQSEIYDYAAYLQSNQLAHDLNYEPRPFSEIEKLIFQREQQLKESLLKNGKGMTQNYAIMSQFISQTMRLFKNKDAEMLNLSCFRTKCVKQFITKMKRWLINWEMKQQYLGNLKKEFVSTVKSLTKQVMLLEENICAKQLSLFKIEKIATVKELIDKIELNFKLGNSFY